MQSVQEGALAVGFAAKISKGTRQIRIKAAGHSDGPRCRWREASGNNQFRIEMPSAMPIVPSPIAVTSGAGGRPEIAGGRLISRTTGWERRRGSPPADEQKGELRDGIR